MTTTTMNEDVANINVIVTRIRAAMKNIIVGQTDMVDLMIASLITDGHILLEGPPGVAKTLAARAMAKLLDCAFSRIQFTPDLMPADIIGTSVFNPKTLEFSYRTGPIFANIVLADEINRAPAKTQAAMFEVMEERQVTQDGVAHALPQPFIVLATQNPIEHEGTYRLPEAQLDRFRVKILIDYPTPSEERQVLQRHHNGTITANFNELRPVASAADIFRMRNALSFVSVEESILEYITNIVVSTRINPLLYVAASPRATVSMMLLAKAKAVLNGRDFVIPDDVISVAKPVLRHRIIVQPEREMEGLTPDAVVDGIIKEIELPR